MVTVTQSVTSLKMRSEAELNALGATVQLTPEAFDDNGHHRGGSRFLLAFRQHRCGDGQRVRLGDGRWETGQQ